MPDIQDAILRYVTDPKYRPVKPSTIAKRLGLEGDDIARTKKIVKQLVKQGKLIFGPSHLVFAIGNGDTPLTEKKQKAEKNLIGTFRRAEGGFGFVRPEGTPAGAGRDADIFVPANGAGDAANGDTVRLRLSGKVGRQGKSEGRVIDVVERATNTFVGTYLVAGGMGLVQIDGKVFSKPVFVGDPGAKGAQPDDKVVVEMVRFPSHVRDGEGVIVEILGKRGQPGVDTLSIIREYNLPGEFSEAVLNDAREQAELFDEANHKHRQDITSETVITIDPATARDFDDAISLTRLENDHWLLGVHIADVSHFVRPKSPLDQEARDRATSVYLPDQVIPMIPEIISNNLASLQPDKVRYALTARIEFSPEGQRIGTDVFKSAMKSCRRFTYEEVDSYLADRTGWKKKLTPEVHSLLSRMHELAMMLRGRRMQRGSLELNMPELVIDLDKDGSVSGAHAAENTESHQIIEEFMLAANEAVAEMLADKGLQFLRRVHGAPEPRKLKALTDFVSELGLKTESLESRFALQDLLAAVKGDSREHAVNYAVLRSMQRAVYSPDEEGHFALASKFYCHFTSPIRRYPDLTIHRLVEAVSRGKSPEQHLGELFALGDHCSDREQRATEAERELKKVKLLLYLQDKVGMQMDGIVTGVENFGLFVTGSQLPAEGFVHITSLADDYYKFDRAGHVIRGFRSGNTYRLGDSVRVAVATVDVERRELDMRLLEKIGGSADGRGTKRKPDKKARQQQPRKGKGKTKRKRK
ncbi:ribonuclease R [Bythopirellula polymerisocia]|uniref:Ribonuclease R n=1 Tax=Bythopirellula polymerisocia TaxID=2528003 RepID=A0A5C6CF78_9BACT|nr:ribonuclease R [Bythopirellula polymerisocia]TWU22772.1 Ribonuclease R [Bythopirellula polymerisocia]